MNNRMIFTLSSFIPFSQLMNPPVTDDLSIFVLKWKDLFDLDERICGKILTWFVEILDCISQIVDTISCIISCFDWVVLNEYKQAGKPDDWCAQKCLPQNCLPVGNPEVGNIRCYQNICTLAHAISSFSQILCHKPNLSSFFYVFFKYLLFSTC